MRFHSKNVTLQLTQVSINKSKGIMKSTLLMAYYEEKARGKAAPVLLRGGSRYLVTFLKKVDFETYCCNGNILEMRWGKP